MEEKKKKKNFRKYFLSKNTRADFLAFFLEYSNYSLIFRQKKKQE